MDCIDNLQSMKKKIFLLALLLITAEAVVSEELWRLTRNNDGILIYQRTGGGSDSEQFIGITSIDATAREIFTISGDISTNRYWMADCTRSDLVKIISENEVIAYYVTEPPWPVTKRDSVIRIRFNIIRGDKFRVEMSSLPEGEAERYVIRDSRMVRIYSMQGFVDIDGKGGKTDIRFGVTGGPGGIVPDFIVRWGGWRIPYNTLSGLRSFIMLKKSQK